MLFSYQTISDICHNHVPMMCGAVIICLLVLPSVIAVCKNRLTNQLQVSICDPSNSSMREESLEELNSSDFVDNIQLINNTARSHISDCVKSLVIFSLLALLLSIPWEFMRLYQKALAERASQIVQGAPSECNPENMTWYESLKSLLRSQFSWTHARNPCQDYYSALLVDPVWEVTPVMVLSSVLVKCFLHPVELISANLAQTLRLFFSEIPVQWQPLFLFFALVIILVILFMYFRYRLLVPLIVRLEPTSFTQGSTHNLTNVINNSCANSLTGRLGGNSTCKEVGSPLRSKAAQDKKFLGLKMSAIGCNNPETMKASQSYTESKKSSRQEGSNFRHLINWTSSKAPPTSPGCSSQTHYPLRVSVTSASSGSPNITGTSDSLCNISGRSTSPRLFNTIRTFTSSASPSITGTSSRSVKITGMSTMFRASNSTTETNDLKNASKHNQTTLRETSNSYRKFIDLCEPNKVQAQPKPRKRNLAKRKTNLDTLWTPRNESYVLSDSD